MSFAKCIDNYRILPRFLLISCRTCLSIKTYLSVFIHFS